MHWVGRVVFAAAAEDPQTMIPIKTPAELQKMRASNRIIAIVLEEIEPLVKAGVSTWELDEWAEKKIRSLGAEPGFKGYGFPPFPTTLCVSINEEVVHGMPRRERLLQEGDIVGVDVGCVLEGYWGDGARTYAVGKVDEQASELIRTCKAALDEAVKSIGPGSRLREIALAVERTVAPKKYGIIRDLTGHGIGRHLHEDPQIFNYDTGEKGPKLREGMTLAIEPMIAAGSWQVRTLEDRWTVVTADSSLSAHWEYTVAITAGGTEVLTRA